MEKLIIDAVLIVVYAVGLFSGLFIGRK